MKQIVTLALLAVAAAAQSPSCIQFGLVRRSQWDLCPALQYHNLCAQHFALAELVPTGSGLGLLLYYDISAYTNLYYGEEMIFTDTTRRYGWEAEACEQRDWTTLAVWWDDRINQPQPGDTLFLRGWQSPGISLTDWPTGLVYRTTYDLSLVPMIHRANYNHWNVEANKPQYWATLIVPTRGWW